MGQGGDGGWGRDRGLMVNPTPGMDKTHRRQLQDHLGQIHQSGSAVEVGKDDSGSGVRNVTLILAAGLYQLRQRFRDELDPRAGRCGLHVDEFAPDEPHALNLSRFPFNLHTQDLCEGLDDVLFVDRHVLIAQMLSGLEQKRMLLLCRVMLDVRGHEGSDGK